ncbi:MAG: hypothetical protein WCS86_03535 [Candidatus Paceibacterota bacterium]
MEHKQETRNCQSCKKDFIIDPEDFNFYEKIKVPPPTFCTECRMVNRMLFRDYRSLHKRKSDKTNEIIFSIFHPKSNCKVIERDIWWSDDWDALDYGKDINFNDSFLKQVKELFIEVPVASQTGWNLINSDYCSGAHDLKNCYLIFVATFCEDCMYSAEINNTKNSIDTTRIESSELCYESFGLIKCYKTFYSSHCEGCMDVWFSRNLVGCNFCFACTNLVNKQYFIYNKQYTKDEYEKIVSDFNIGSYKSNLEIKKKVDEIMIKSIKKFMEGRKNLNVSGEYINNSKNVLSSYYINQAEDSKYLQLFFSSNTKDCYDCTLWGEKVELCYECSSVGSDAYNIRFCCRCSKGSRNCEYSFNCLSCSDIFGCSGLKSKQYCILNKQYTKREYEELVPKIRQHMIDMPYFDKMNRVYRYGDFFPSEFSLFSYNESFAQDYFPLTKKDAMIKGYNWSEKEERNYKIDIKQEDIPDNILDVNDSIIGKVIECLHYNVKDHFGLNCDDSCTEAFRITGMELSFYKRIGLPLPRVCPNCRHFERIKMRNSIRLFKRRCMKEGCQNEFETSYSPDRPEIVYCERCYQQEVY